jgi:twitching motility two-component system response regulator PilH
MAAGKILVVDDSPTELKLIVSALETLACEIITATDGELALRSVVQEKPDLIVMDVVMPKIDGFQACRKIKSSSDFKHVPIILLTSKNQKSDEFWGKKQGADIYLTKPFDEKVLRASVKKFLGLG